jgi:hypothetical protein
MSRATKKAKSGKAGRLRTIPWAALLQGGVVVTRRLKDLSGKDRERLTALLRESRGRIGNLTEKERKELRKLAGKLDLKAMGGELLALRSVTRRRRRRGH